MNDATSRMKREWDANTLKYTDPIGMTGRRPVSEEFDAVVRDLRSKLKLDEGAVDSVLDVGCSNGYLLHRLQTDAPRVVGVDFCLSPLQQGSNHHPAFQFIQAEAGCLPFKTAIFSRIICYNMYHYLPEPETGYKLAENLYHLLQPGGILLIGDLFTEEHAHDIPEADRQRWNSEERPFMHRMANWMFISVNMLRDRLEQLGAFVEILSQTGPLRCQGYRFDVRATRGGQQF